MDHQAPGPAGAPPAPGWWLAGDGRWYPPELHPSDTPLNANWWQAQNGQWFAPLFHPDNRAAYDNYIPPVPPSPPPAVEISPEPTTFAPKLYPDPPSHARHAVVSDPPTASQPPAVSTVPAPQAGYNSVFEVHWKGGWPGIFTGESQAKALTRTLVRLNGEGWRVSAAVTDRWSFFKRLGKALLAIVTLGFVVHHQNIILVVERIY